MSQDSSADAVRQNYIQSMGEELGSVFHALWYEVTTIHMKWKECEELFCTKPSRVELMNRAAPLFFHIVENSLFENILIHITRLTDPATTFKKDNLTIQRLPDLITDSELAKKVRVSIDLACAESAFCRDWRNRKLAHADLELALNPSANALESATCESIRTALAAIANALNLVHAHYMEAEIGFGWITYSDGALSLLRVLDDGLRAREQRKERIKRGEYSPNDPLWRDL